MDQNDRTAGARTVMLAHVQEVCAVVFLQKHLALVAKHRVFVVEPYPIEARVIQNGLNKKDWHEAAVVSGILAVPLGCRFVLFVRLLDGALHGETWIRGGEHEAGGADHPRLQVGDAVDEARPSHRKALQQFCFECIKYIDAHGCTLEEAEGAGEGAEGAELGVLLLTAHHQLVSALPLTGPNDHG